MVLIRYILSLKKPPTVTNLWISSWCTYVVILEIKYQKNTAKEMLIYNTPSNKYVASIFSFTTRVVFFL